MRKAFLICFLLVFGIQMFLSAQTKFSSYHNSYFDKTYNVMIDSDERLYIGCESKDAKELYVVIENKQYEDFVEFIKKIKHKYSEWDSIAKANKVMKLNKDMAIYSPQFSVSWKSSEWWWSFGHKEKVLFLILDGKSVAVISKMVASSENKYIDETFYLTFASLEDFEELLSAINIDEGKKILEKKSNTESLFQ